MLTWRKRRQINQIILENYTRKMHKFARFPPNVILIDSCTFAIRLFMSSVFLLLLPLFHLYVCSLDLHVIKIQSDHYGVMREMQRFSPMILSVLAARAPLRNAMV